MEHMAVNGGMLFLFKKINDNKPNCESKTTVLSKHG